MFKAPLLLSHWSTLSLESLTVEFNLPARILPKPPSKPMKDSREAHSLSPPAIEVFCSTCQIAFRLLPKCSWPLKPMREPKSAISVAVLELFSLPSAVAVFSPNFTLDTSTPAFTWPYRVTSAIAATGRAARVRAIRDFFIAVFLF